MLQEEFLRIMKKTMLGEIAASFFFENFAQGTGQQRGAKMK